MYRAFQPRPLVCAQLVNGQIQRRRISPRRLAVFAGLMLFDAVLWFVIGYAVRGGCK